MTGSRAGAWPTGGYPGPGTNPADKRHEAEGG